MQNPDLTGLSGLEDIIGYSFRQKELMELALTHPSWSGEMKKNRTESNQRLEFLGDSVLELVISEDLYLRHPDLGEGELTRMRASLVCEAALCFCAENISLGNFLYLGKGEEKCGGREKPSILSDAFESLIGAVYLDGGFEAAKNHIHRFVLDVIQEFDLLKDGKSMIQELVQKDSNAKLSYDTSEEPDSKNFTSFLKINGELIARGEGHTKKAAEQKAALEALKLLQKGNRTCF